MNAKICDRCGLLWRDESSCEVKINTLILSKGNSHSDRINELDLCDHCYKGLFEYLKPAPMVEDTKN